MYTGETRESAREKERVARGVSAGGRDAPKPAEALSLSLSYNTHTHTLGLSLSSARREARAAAVAARARVHSAAPRPGPETTSQHYTRPARVRSPARPLAPRSRSLAPASRGIAGGSSPRPAAVHSEIRPMLDTSSR